MKKIILAVAAMLMAPAANAQDISILCPSIGDWAFNVMNARQHGMPKSEVVDIVRPGPVYNMSIAVVDLAYSMPVYESELAKNASAESFQHKVEYVCYANSN